MESRNPASLNESGARLVSHIGKVSGGEQSFKIVVVYRVSLAVELVQPSDFVLMQMLLKLQGLLQSVRQKGQVWEGHKVISVSLRFIALSRVEGSHIIQKAIRPSWLWQVFLFVFIDFK
jgi:hypothetical protein